MAEAMADMEAARKLTTQLNSLMKWWLAWHEVTYVANLCPEKLHLSEALSMAQEIEQRSPRSAIYKLVCGLALHRSGRHAEAVRKLERYLEIEVPPESTALFSLAMAYHANGQKVMAIKTFHWGERRMHETYPDAPLIKLMHEEAAKKVGVAL